MKSLYTVTKASINFCQFTEAKPTDYLFTARAETKSSSISNLQVCSCVSISFGDISSADIERNSGSQFSVCENPKLAVSPSWNMIPPYTSQNKNDPPTSFLLTEKVIYWMTITNLRNYVVWTYLSWLQWIWKANWSTIIAFTDVVYIDLHSKVDHLKSF